MKHRQKNCSFKLKKIKKKVIPNQSFDLKFLQSANHVTIFLHAYYLKVILVANNQFKLQTQMNCRMARVRKYGNHGDGQVYSFTPFPENLVSLYEM